MNKHTLGPWHFEPVGTVTADIYADSSLANGFRIAQGVRLNNAQLIAAAPDLAEALQHQIMRASVEFTAADIARSKNRMQEIARDALAKAGV